MYLLNSAGIAAIWDQISAVDRKLFTFINYDTGNGFFDAVLLFLRESQLWVPFYLFMVLFMTMNFGARGWWWCLVFVLTAALADIISSQLIKENIFRLRPCRDPSLSLEMIFRAKYCPKSSSFTSSHATSHFALSMFIWRTLKPLSRWWGMIFLWALSICYAQVYVGVHYPLDVVCGGLLGSGIGLVMAFAFTRKIGPVTG